MSSPPTLLDRLRAGTRATHDAIERDLHWQQRVATSGGYRDLLARWYGVHAAWEPVLTRLIADEDFLRPRRRCTLLTADLTALGLSGAAVACLPRIIVTAQTAADAWGAVYVLEGATLGGQVVARHVAATFGPDAGCDYFRGHGAATGRLWREVCARLNGQTDGDAVVAAADRMFAALRGWLVAG